jgi:hypothetical protein
VPHIEERNAAGTEVRTCAAAEGLEAMNARARYTVWTATGPSWPHEARQVRTGPLPKVGAHTYARQLAARGERFVSVRQVGADVAETVMPSCEEPTAGALCGRGNLVEQLPGNLARCPEHVPPPPAPVLTPTPPTVIDPAHAAWIREHVLPKRYRDDRYYRMTVELCACQWGICGACDRGRHDHCLSAQHAASGRRIESPEAYIVDRRGFVASGVGVWRATGTPCRYRCPCPTCAQLAAMPPAPTPPPPPTSQEREQLSLF